MVDMGVHSEQAFENGFYHGQEIFRKRYSYFKINYYQFGMETMSSC